MGECLFWKIQRRESLLGNSDAQRQKDTSKKTFQKGSFSLQSRRVPCLSDGLIPDHIKLVLNKKKEIQVAHWTSSDKKQEILECLVSTSQTTEFSFILTNFHNNPTSYYDFSS